MQKTENQSSLRTGHQASPVAEGKLLTPSTPSDLSAFIDHTLLKADATSEDIRRLCQEAITYKFKAVCVNPNFVNLASQLVKGSGVLVASVVGFPLGAHLSAIKEQETAIAIHDGASEVDMVIRLDLVKENRWPDVETDIAAVVRGAKGNTVKVILETGLLSVEQIAQACRASENAGAHFVKTATGFLGRGATIEDIELMRKSCAPHMQIKASGGVKSFEQAKALIASGATRIGTSSGVTLVSSPSSTTPTGNSY